MSEAVAKYFTKKRTEMTAKSDFHQALAKKSRVKTDKSYHEDRAWHFGVSMVAYLFKMEAEIQQVLRRER